MDDAKDHAVETAVGFFYFGTFLAQKLADAFPREQITPPPGQVGAYCCSRKIKFSNIVLDRKWTTWTKISQTPRHKSQPI